jgi:hypothetical protein
MAERVGFAPSHVIENTGLSGFRLPPDPLEPHKSPGRRTYCARGTMPSKAARSRRGPAARPTPATGQADAALADRVGRGVQSGARRTVTSTFYPGTAGRRDNASGDQSGQCGRAGTGPHLRHGADLLTSHEEAQAAGRVHAGDAQGIAKPLQIIPAGRAHVFSFRSRFPWCRRRMACGARSVHPIPPALRRVACVVDCRVFSAFWWRYRSAPAARPRTQPHPARPCQARCYRLPRQNRHRNPPIPSWESCQN